jgi:uncharacterized protein (TIGR03435 family)
MLMRAHLVLLFALSAAALQAQTAPAFEVSTVRRTAGPIPGVPPIFGQQRTTADTLTARHTMLVEIIRRAFGVVEQELVGGPSWIRDERFDIVGKSAAPATDAELWLMVRPLLEERFKLKYHREPREVSGLALVVGKNGPKLTRSEGGSNQISAAGGVITGRNVTLARLAAILSSVMRRPVMDATGLDGTYNFTVDPRPYATPGPPDLPTMMITAIQEELGLRLESRKFELQVMVIDHIEPPDEN